MRLAVYPGSFDPVTFGHLDLIRRGVRLADRLLVAVAVNVGRDALFTLDERVALLKAEIKGIREVRVERFDGMIVDFVRMRKASAILRGVRTVSDFEVEMQMALTNRALGRVETVFVMPNPEYAFLSAKLIREVATLGGDVSSFVPRRVVKALRARMRERDPWQN
jgi:pantetheine-phosphate adenylyltransferase